MKPRIVIILVGISTLTASLALSMKLFSQTQPSIRGTVTDQSGALLPGVHVMAVQSDGSLTSVLTNEIGGYAFTGLSAGVYSIRADLSGFQTETRGIEFRPSSPARLDLTMKLFSEPSSPSTLSS